MDWSAARLLSARPLGISGGQGWVQFGELPGGYALAGPGGRPGPGVVSVELVLHGRGSVAELAARLQEIGGVLTVHAGDQDADG